MEGISLKLVCPIVADEQLHDVGVTHDRTGQENDLRHVVDVLLGN